MSYELKEAFEKGHAVDGTAHAFSEGIWIPAETFFPVAVASVTYQGSSAPSVAAVGLAEQNALAGMDFVHVIAGATTSAILTLPLPFSGKLFSSGASGATRGVVIQDISIPYVVNAQVLTGVMTVQAFIYSFKAPAVAAAVPAAGAAITPTLVASSCPLAVNTAGQFQTAQWTFAGGYAVTGDYQAVKFRLTIPMTNAGTVDLAGAFVRFALQ